MSQDRISQIAGQYFEVGEYCFNVVDGGVVCVGPNPAVAQAAGVKLAALLETEEGCKRLGRYLRAKRTADTKNLVAEMAVILGLPVTEPDFFESLKPREAAKLDYDDDQMKIYAFRFPGLCDRTITELHGMCTAIVYDGKVDDAELVMLENWLKAQAVYRDYWPISELYDIMAEVLADNIVTDEERDRIRRFLESIDASPERQGKAGDCIFDENPKFIFRDTVFCITGKLKLCKRADAWAQIEARGGIVANNPSKKVNVLVVGDDGSEVWQFSRYGRKIEAMVSLREAGHPVQIVRERDFVGALEKY